VAGYLHVVNDLPDPVPTQAPAPEAATLRIHSLHTAETGLLRLSGELDPSTADRLLADAEALLDAGVHAVVLDCHELTFCDSYGLRAMGLLWQRLQPHGTVTIARPSAMLRRLLDVTGLSTRLEVTAATG
jgi:anti-anti-sigma factor